jgi:hypothetical protein
MKICSKCKQEKEYKEFNKDLRRNKITSWCKQCVRSRSKQHYDEKGILKKEKRKIYIQQRREWFNEFKKTLKCIKCEENHISCLEFHHRNPEEKDFEIAAFVSTASKEKILNEIKKCDVLCSNCHRKTHWEQKQTKSN